MTIRLHKMILRDRVKNKEPRVKTKDNKTNNVVKLSLLFYSG